VKRGLVAGFGGPIGAADLLRIASWGFDCIRQDVRLGTDPTAIIAELAGRDLFPLLIVRFPDVARVIPIALAKLGQRFAIELYDPLDIGSEPNGLVPADQFAKGVTAGYTLARGLGFRGDVISGGVSNVDAGALAYLAQIIPQMPLDVIIGVHRYSPGGRSWQSAHFSSRDEEWRRLKQVLGLRRYALTEGGYDTAVHPVPWFRSWFGLFGSDWQRTDQEAGLDIALEWTYWQSHGAEYYCLFQFRDGLTAGEHFGLLRADGSVKQPLVDVLIKATR